MSARKWRDVDVGGGRRREIVAGVNHAGGMNRDVETANGRAIRRLRVEPPIRAPRSGKRNADDEKANPWTAAGDLIRLPHGRILRRQRKTWRQ